MVRSLSLSEHLLKSWRFLYLLLIILGCTLFHSKVAFGCVDCGGKGTYDLGLTTSFEALRTILKTGGTECDSDRRDEFLFLYPFTLDKPKEMAPLWKIIYGWGPPSFARPNADFLKSALRSGDWKTAGMEARKIVDQVLDMPGNIAAKCQPAFVQALEFLEIQPLFQQMDPEIIRFALWGDLPAEKIRDLPPEILDVLAMRHLDRQNVDRIIEARPHHPRMATLRFVALRNEFARKVPDGWLYDIQKKVSEETWRELEESVDLWLKDYPHHPLADLVLLWKTRIYYFKGDTDRAWKLLISVYPRRLPRVLYEMRYLLRHVAPPAESLRTITDPLLFTALLSSLRIDSEQWTQWWRVSEENLAQPWATNLQERLLAKVPETGELPLSFPREPRNPTPLWGKLRAFALMNAGQWEDARKQLCSLAPDEDQALLAATFHLRRGNPLLAAQVIDLPKLIRLYLVRVIFGDEDLRELENRGNMTLRMEVLFEQGVRLAEKGQWADAAQIVRTVDPVRSELWQEVAQLKMDTPTSAPLRLARFLRDNSGKLFYDSNAVWDSTVTSRYWLTRGSKAHTAESIGSNGLPWTPDQELEAITRHFLGTTELWPALQAYVDWLSTAQPSPQMSQVTKEADYCYNRLIGPGYWNWRFWTEYLSDHPVVKRLRKEGKRAKLAQG